MVEGKGWHGDTPGHEKAALKGLAGNAMNKTMKRNTTVEQDRVGLHNDLTPLELDVLLHGFGENEYISGKAEDSAVWSWALQSYCKLCKAGQISGIVSSLVQKGIMYSTGKGEDAYVGLTEKGKKIFQELNKPETAVASLKNAVVQQHIEEYFDCPHCQAFLSAGTPNANLKDELQVGKIIQCPECKNRIKITEIRSG